MPATKTDKKQNTASPASPPNLMTKIKISIYNIIFLALYICFGILLCYMKFVWNDMLNAQLTRNQFFNYIKFSQQSGLVMSVINLVSNLSSAEISNASHKVKTTTLPSLLYEIDDKKMYKHVFNDNHSFIEKQLNEFSKNSSNSIYRFCGYYLAELYYMIYFFASLFYDIGMPDIITIFLGPFIFILFFICASIMSIFIMPISIFKTLEYDWSIYAYPLTFCVILLLYFVFFPILPLLHFYFLFKCIKGMFIDVKNYIDKDKVEINVSEPIQGTRINPIKGKIISSSLPSPPKSPLTTPLQQPLQPPSKAPPLPQLKGSIPSSLQPTTPVSTTPESTTQDSTQTAPDSTTQDSTTQDSTQPAPESTPLPDPIKTGGGKTTDKNYKSKKYTYLNYAKDMLITNGWLQYMIFILIIMQLSSINNMVGLIFIVILVLLVLYNLFKYKRLFFKTYDEKKALKHDWLINSEEPIVLDETKQSLTSKVLSYMKPLVSGQIKETLQKLDAPGRIMKEMGKYNNILLN